MITIKKLNNKNHEYGYEHEGILYRGKDPLGKLCRSIDHEGKMRIEWPCGKLSGYVNVSKRREKSLYDNDNGFKYSKFRPFDGSGVWSGSILKGAPLG